MTMRLHDNGQFQVRVESNGMERREHRRHDLEQQQLIVQRWDGHRRSGKPLGCIVDLSPQGVRIRTSERGLRPDHQIRIRLELPPSAGICPFVDRNGDNLQPKREWVGWMTVCRIDPIDEKQSDVCGQLVDMDEMDRGMLGLYLSCQPLAA